jgi:hypothetical protein
MVNRLKPAWFYQSKTVALVALLLVDMMGLPESLRVSLLVINILLLALLHALSHEYIIMAVVMVSAMFPPTDALTMRLYAMAMLFSHSTSSQFDHTLGVLTIMIPWIVFELLMLARKNGQDRNGAHASCIAIRVRAVVLLLTFAAIALHVDQLFVK